jgi:hypothetical protein
MVIESSATEGRLPTWAHEVLSQYVDRHVRRRNVLRLSVDGIAGMRGRARLMEVLAKGKEKDGLEGSQAAIAQAKEDEKLAEFEITHGFPVLYEQASIALWSGLEALIRLLVAQVLFNVPDARKCEVVQSLKVKIGDYESLDELERCLWIADLIDQGVVAP